MSVRLLAETIMFYLRYLKNNEMKIDSEFWYKASTIINKFCIMTCRRKAFVFY
jgi:hypothetical protein